MEPESFDEVRGLDDAALRLLLEQGRPEQRVWALWVLAQRAGEAAGQLASGQADQPDPGVRRTLAVVLASHGELDLLVALARHDPAPIVRASALQLVARLAAGGPSAEGRGGDVDALRAVIEAERDPAGIAAILGVIGAGSPEFLIGLAERALGEAPFDVQLEAAEALLRIGTPQGFEQARRWLLGLEDPIPACDPWIRAAGELGDPGARAAGIDSLSRALAGAPVQTRARVLQRLVAPPWAAVARLVEGADSLLREVLQRSDIEIPAPALAGAILRGLHGRFMARLTKQLEHAGYARALLAEVRRGLADDVQPALAELMGRALGLVRARKIAGAEGVLAELAQLHPVEQLVGLENALACWIHDPEIDALAGMLPELGAYCERRLADMRAAARREERRYRAFMRELGRDPLDLEDADDADDDADAGDEIDEVVPPGARERFEALLAAIRALPA